ncbi:MAG: glycoside hydrolase family 5 protein, partial [Methanomicrobiales archaeon]|nr:glycoside hydrolase family 5 protein [Methanomicrobiales archaeon]
MESGKRGFIRANSPDRYFLQYDNNETYIPIGHNVCWLSESGSGQWREFFEKMSNAGENWTRLWMCHFYQGTTLEWTSNYGGWEGAGRLSMSQAWKIDRIIESCEQNDIGMQLVLQHHGQYSTTTDENWDDNPYNITHAAEGGFLADANQFFTDANAIRLSKNKYRYIVARWGYSPAILAWELFNEVQFTDCWMNSSQASVVNWHNTMASYIRGIDPFRHPVTTSSHGPGFENLWSLPDINIIQVHYYGPDTINSLKQSAMNLLSFNKPTFMAEFGAGGMSEAYPDSLPEPQRSQIYEGLPLHNGIWSTCLLRSTANLWWWENYIDLRDLYDVFTPLAIYTAGEDLADYNLSIAPRAVTGAVSIYANPERWEWSFYPQKEFY